MRVEKAMSAAGTTPIDVKSLGRIFSIVTRSKTLHDTNGQKRKQNASRVSGVIPWEFVY